MTHLYHSYIPFNSSITANWNTFELAQELYRPRIYPFYYTFVYRYSMSQHLSPLINLSAFAEHLTRQFPIVGGPRAFAQPNNFEPRRRSIPQYDPSVFPHARWFATHLVARYRFHTKCLRIFSCWGVYSP